MEWSSGKPVKVEYMLPTEPNPTWTDITSDFNVTGGANPRDVIVTPTTTLDWDNFVSYRITPVLSGSNLLKCSGLTVGGNVAVSNYTYTLNAMSPP